MMKLVRRWPEINIKKGLNGHADAFLGKDATESFEDIGHSDEARELLEKFYIGELDTTSPGVSPNETNLTCLLTPPFFIGC